MDSPPVPTSVQTECIVPSVVDPKLSYVIRPLRNSEQPEASLTTRLINRKRTPLVRKMRELMLTHDFSGYFDARDQSRIKELISALLADAMGLEDEDIEFAGLAEAVIAEESEEYYNVALADEKLGYDLRLANLAALLYATERDGERAVFPPNSVRQRHRYLRSDVDPKDILEITLASANMIAPTEDTVKNSEPLSTSDSDPVLSSVANGQ